jgi:hypothetical protein
MDTRSFAYRGFPATPVVHVALNVGPGGDTKCPHGGVYIASDPIRYNQSSRRYLHGPGYRGGQIDIASRGDEPATHDSRGGQLHLAAGNSQISPDAAADRYLAAGSPHILRNGSR